MYILTVLFRIHTDKTSGINLLIYFSIRRLIKCYSQNVNVFILLEGTKDS